MKISEEKVEDKNCSLYEKEKLDFFFLSENAHANETRLKYCGMLVLLSLFSSSKQQLLG